MNSLRPALLALLIFGPTCLSARHFYQPHTPFQTQHPSAPESHKRPLTIHSYASAYSRVAHDAFNHHGIARQPLSALYFGKSDFRMSEMFKNCFVPHNTEHYSPFVRIMKMRPRVQYSEFGSHLGVTAWADIDNKRWRCGARVDIPVIHREIERKDHGTRGRAHTQDLVYERPYKVTQDDDPDNFRIDRSYAYRLDFLEAQAKNVHHDSAVDYSSNQIQVFNRQLRGSSATELGAALIHSPEGYVPRGKNVGANKNESGKTMLPQDFSGLQTGTVYYVPREVAAVNYSGRADSATKPVLEQLADQDAKATLWVVPTYNTTDADSLIMQNDSESIQTSMNDALKDHNANEFEWLHDRGFEVESAQAMGLGDVTIEFFGSYLYNKRCLINCVGGFTLPTAAGTTNSSGPYHIHLGYRNHVVVFGGMGFEAGLKNSLFTLTGNAKLSAVLPGKEERCAMPTGAQVKNLGPLVEATTSWRFFDGDLWLHMQHPYSSRIRCSLGYKLYWKSDDSISFTPATVDSLLGKTYDVTRDGNGDVLSGTQDYTAANRFTPDKGVSVAKSEMIAHSLSWRLHYHISEWFQVNTGGSYTIAGKNAPQSIEGSIGCVVAF